MIGNSPGILVSRTDECIEALCEDLFFEFSTNNKITHGFPYLIIALYNLCIFIVINENNDEMSQIDIENSARILLIKKIYKEFTDDKLLHHDNKTLSEKVQCFRHFTKCSEVFDMAVKWAKVNLARNDSIDKAAGYEYGGFIDAI